MPARPVYVLAPRGTASPLIRVVPGHEAVPVASAAELRGREPGVLLVRMPVDDPAELVEALLLCAEAPSASGWLPVIVHAAADGGPERLVPVSLGWPATSSELARWADGAQDAAVLELRHVLQQVGRARHDVNNPLTSAMAETQLALMDARDPVLRQGLEVVEEQLRRIRDLIAELRLFRPPR